MDAIALHIGLREARVTMRALSVITSLHPYLFILYYTCDRGVKYASRGCVLITTTRISLRKTVLYDETSGMFCQCSGDFYKTCSLRAAHDLPCIEAILSITPVDRGDETLADKAVRSLGKAVEFLQHDISSIASKPRI